MQLTYLQLFTFTGNSFWKSDEIYKHFTKELCIYSRQIFLTSVYCKEIVIECNLHFSFQGIILKLNKA